MKKNGVIRTMAALLACACLPFAAVPAAAVQETPEPLDIIRTSLTQNGARLAPHVTSADGTEQTLSKTSVSGAEGLRSAANLPSSYDLRDVDGTSYVTRAKNQGSTGLCWAFSTLGACESNIMKQGLDIPDEWLDENGELNFSEASLGWYTFTDHNQPGDFTSGDYLKAANDKKGLGGGNIEIASAALASGSGTQRDCYAPLSRWEFGYSEYQRFVSYYRFESSDTIWQLESGSESIVKNWLMDSGAVSVSFHSDQTLYHDNGESCCYYQNQYDGTYADHAVLIVGWDDSYSRMNFALESRPKKDGAWLVRNSWGDDAYDGYFWISYEEPSLCEFGSVHMRAAEDETCYQYDGTVSYCGLRTPCAANVFTAQEDGTLTAVMFPNAGDNMEHADTAYYTVCVYRLSQDAKDPTDGQLLTRNTGSLSYSGYKNVPVTPVALKKGDRFSVTLQLTDRANGKGAPLYLALEESVEEEPLSRHYSILPGQSYLQDNAHNWWDITKFRADNPYCGEIGNMAIKAIVKNDGSSNPTQLLSALQTVSESDVLETAGNERLNQAYTEAAALPQNAAQPLLDNAARNLLAELEQEKVLQYPRYLYANTTWKQGDVDEDGDITLDDAFLALQSYSNVAAGNLSPLLPAQVMAANVNGNDSIEMDDAFAILQYYAIQATGEEPDWSTLIR